MKNFYKQILILLPLALLFSSCVNMTRNIVLKKDGSGSEKMEINISSEFFRMMQGLASLDTTKKVDVFDDSKIISEIKKNFKGNDLVHLKNISSTTGADSSKNLLVDYSFKDIKAITVSLDDSGEDSKSKIFMKEQDGIIKFYYEMANEEKENNDNSMNDLNEKMFDGKQFILNIKFPYDVITSNATSQDGRTLTWIRPMNVISKPGSKEIFEAELRK